MTKEKKFVASAEAKGKAKQFRLFAMLAWIVAIAGEVFTIFKLLKNDMLTWLIVAIVVILVLAIVGNLLWKKANRMDPPSEKDKVKFFLQSQLGAIMAVLAFLPLVLLIFFNKDLDGKTKGIAGGVAIVALLAAGITGIDFDPASVEKYTEEINAQRGEVQRLIGKDHIFWTPSGNKLHLYDDCHHIRNSDVSEGTVEDAWHARKIDNNEICKTCENKAEKRLEEDGGEKSFIEGLMDDAVETLTGEEEELLDDAA